MTPAQLLDRLDPEGTMASLNRHPQLTITGPHAVTKGSLQERELLLEKLRQAVSANQSPASSNESDLSIGEIEAMLTSLPRSDSMSVKFRSSMKEVRDILYKTKGDVLNETDFKDISVPNSAGYDHRNGMLSQPSSNKVDSTTVTPAASRGKPTVTFDAESTHLNLPIIEEPNEEFRPSFSQHRSQPNSVSSSPAKKTRRQLASYISEFDQAEQSQPRRRAMTESHHRLTSISADGGKRSHLQVSRGRGNDRRVRYNKDLFHFEVKKS